MAQYRQRSARQQFQSCTTISVVVCVCSMNDRGGSVHKRKLMGTPQQLVTTKTMTVMIAISCARPAAYMAQLTLAVSVGAALCNINCTLELRPPQNKQTHTVGPTYPSYPLPTPPLPIRPTPKCTHLSVPHQPCGHAPADCRQWSIQRRNNINLQMQHTNKRVRTNSDIWPWLRSHLDPSYHRLLAGAAPRSH
jgi:hypothetical protein